MQLSATHGVAEPLSLMGIQTSGPHSGFRHRHSGQLLYCTFRFQKKRVIICFSPDFLRILQKDLFYDGKLSHTRRCRTLLTKKRQCCMKPINDWSQLFDRLIQARQISPESYIFICKRRKHRPDMGYHQRTAPAYGLYRLNLAGNVGHQNAPLAGLNAVKDRCEIAGLH